MNPQFQQMLQEATRLTRAGRLDEATRMIQHALRGQPGKGESAEARDVPAQMPGGPPAAMNEAAAALPWLQRALTAKPDDLPVLTSMAEAQLLAGDATSARATLTHALALQPANRELQRLERRIRKAEG